MPGGRSRRRTVAGLVGGTGAVAVALVLWALPSFVRFAAHAPAEFWAIALVALLIDAPLFGTGRRYQPVRPSLTPGLALGILLLWGLGPAVIVQLAAAVVTAVGQRQGALGGTFLTSRLVCGLGAAAVALHAVSPNPFVAPGEGMHSGHIVPFLSAASAWFVVAFGLLFVVGAVAQRGGARGVRVTVRGEMLRSVTHVLLVPPLLTLTIGWWALLVAVPLLTWNLRARDYLQTGERLRREQATGLLNRQGLLERLETLTMFDPLRPERPRPLGVVFVNVEALPAIARSLGRDMYEKVVRAGALRLIRAFGSDRVGRLSGEGFIVLMPGLTDPDAIAEASEVVRVLQPLIVVDDIPFDLDSAAGVALSPEHGRDLDELLTRAQLAVGDARRLGKPAAVYFKQAQDETDRRTAILADLHTALLDSRRHDEIGVVYQPQIELSSGRLVGAEALVRWNHPVWGPVRPDELIDAVESSEVMHLLTLHMLDKVGAQLAEWAAQGLHLRGSVNVSMQDLHDSGFPAQISAVLRRRGIPPDCLTIEVTERLLVGDAAGVARAATSVAELGVGLSLDDFGTGYASMQQLRDLPLTEVKIDKSYVSSLLGDGVQRAIVTSVHQLANAMGLAVVAEGVEDERTAAELAALPGVIGQGWYFGHPVAAEDFYERWYRQIQPGQ